MVEAAPEFKRIGYMFALYQQIGQEVATGMGIFEKLKNFEVPLTKNVLRDLDGRPITSFELDYATHNKRVGLMLNRADLH